MLTHPIFLSFFLTAALMSMYGSLFLGRGFKFLQEGLFNLLPGGFKFAVHIMGIE